MTDETLERNDETVGEEAPKSRNATQSEAMSAIFAILTHFYMDRPVDVEAAVSGACGEDYENCPYFPKAAAIMTVKKLGEAIDFYKPFLRKWTFDRLNRTVQSILILSYVHFFYLEPEVDKAIVIDIAVKLAKAYAGDKDYRFVNAILDNSLKRPAESDD